MNNCIENMIINKDENIINALKTINETSKGIVYVVDHKGKLVGTLTDGDIRRALINGIGLHEGVNKVMNSNPIKAIKDTNVMRLKELMIKGAIRELPLVDEENILVDSICLNELLIPKGKDNYVLVMAGGLGTRLKELTVEIPKPMLNLGDKPILHHIIERFKGYGFNKFLLSVNYKSEIIENYFQDGVNYECKINYLREKKRLGTGGAISLAKEYIKDDFFVVNGDIYSTVNLNEVMEVHKNNNNDITIVSVKKNVNIQYGVLEVENNKVTDIIEKPNYEFLISGGIYCLSPRVMELIPQNEYFEITDLFTKAMERKMKVESFIIDDYWIDIGRIEDYDKINRDLNKLICCTQSND